MAAFGIRENEILHETTKVQPVAAWELKDQGTVGNVRAKRGF
jgi:hypothetical protein